MFIFLGIFVVFLLIAWFVIANPGLIVKSLGLVFVLFVCFLCALCVYFFFHALGDEVRKNDEKQKVENAALKRPSPLSEPSLTALPEISAAAASRAAVPSIQNTYRVVGVRRTDYLTVRSGPGTTYSVVAKLSANEQGITLGTKRVNNGPTVWQEIITDRYTGWVNADHLALDSSH